MRSIITRKKSEIKITEKKEFGSKVLQLSIDNCLADTFDYDVEATLDIEEAKKLVDILLKSIKDAEE